MELIDRQAAIEIAKGYCHPANIAKELEKLSSAHPTPKTVIYSGDGYADGYMVYDSAECPECGYEYEESDKAWGEPYCPHCGQLLNWDTEGEQDG